MYGREVFGSTESVSIPLLGVDSTIAKIDTGAWSGALHCTAIHERDGVLYFNPLGDKSLATSTSNYKKRKVRSATGHVVERYIIPVEVIVRDRRFHTTIGLSDRRTMKREVSLGRKFLIENNIIVDVALTLDDDYEAERYL